jgi:predicted ATPase
VAENASISQAPPAVRIRKVSIERLFGALDHQVTLNSDARVTIVLGANGVGKTHLLECVSALFSAHLERLVAVPFHSIKVDLDDGTSLRVEQRAVEIPRKEPGPEEAILARSWRRRAARRTKVRRNLTIQLLREDGTALSEPWEPLSQPGHRARGEVPGLPPWVEHVEFGCWFDQQNDRMLTTRELRVLYGHEEGAFDDIPEWFKSTLERTSVRLIETQRLLRTHRKHPRHSVHEQRAGAAVQFAVRDLLEDLTQRMAFWRQRYSRQASSLDQTYVDRFLRYQASESSTEQLQQQLSAIAQRRARLEGLSLLDVEGDTQTGPLLMVSEEKRLALSLFASDMDQKLSVLEAAAEQLETLLSTVNRKLSSTGKKLATDQAVGLVVKTDDGNQILDLEQLSSGEQHEVVLLYDLLFRVRQQSLVLIDEPELSLHPAWQQEFVDDLMAIAKTKEFDVVLATHSPYIVGARSALCVTLKHSEQIPG